MRQTFNPMNWVLKPVNLEDSAGNKKISKSVMTGSAAGLIDQTHDKLRSLVKALINNRSAEDDGERFQKIHISKFIKDIGLLLQGHVDRNKEKSLDRSVALLALEHNYKDLWALLQLLEKDSQP